MSIFKRNDDTSGYVEGKKHIIDVLKNDGPKNATIWRDPRENFNNHSRLIVDPNEAAIFLDNGKVAAVYTSGTYELETDNHFITSVLKSQISGGVTSARSKLFFINLSRSKEILWGTGGLQVIDQVSKLHKVASARATATVKVSSPELLFNELGQQFEHALSINNIIDDYFHEKFHTPIDSLIVSYLTGYEGELTNLTKDMESLSKMLVGKIDDMLSEMGLECSNFSVTSISVRDDEAFEKQNKLVYESMNIQIETQRGLAQNYVEGNRIETEAAAQAKGASYNPEGYNLFHQWQYNEKMASNAGVGGMANLGAGIGMGLNALNAYGQSQQNGNLGMMPVTPAGVQPMSYNPGTQQMYPNQPAQQMNAGTQTVVQEDPVEVLGKLKKMLEAGLIEQAEFDAKKLEILSRM